MTVPTLVLLPGMDGTGDLFGTFLSELGQGYPVKVVSYPTSGRFGYLELESIVKSALPVGVPFVILGESFSGPLAIAAAASRPPGLKGLILCCTFVRNPRPGFRASGPLVDVLPMGAIAARCASIGLLGRFSTAALRGAFLRALGKVAPEAIRARLRSVISVDVTGELASVDVPILYLRATADRVVPAGASDLIKGIKPGTSIVDVDAPHFLLQAAPGPALEVIREFLDSVVGAS